ncbi:uncharacterized protein LOC119642817, partial [Glossina fuscipes]|uniref:Uncharacterized protein LOC119642817 n=1 Tax=Glossina fuscipes TaxID=7396 RepID=A0A9C6DZZ4_9MUSC
MPRNAARKLNKNVKQQHRLPYLTRSTSCSSETVIINYNKKLRKRKTKKQFQTFLKNSTEIKGDIKAVEKNCNKRSVNSQFDIEEKKNKKQQLNDRRIIKSFIQDTKYSKQENNSLSEEGELEDFHGFNDLNEDTVSVDAKIAANVDEIVHKFNDINELNVNLTDKIINSVRKHLNGSQIINKDDCIIKSSHKNCDNNKILCDSYNKRDGAIITRAAAVAAAAASAVNSLAFKGKSSPSAAVAAKATAAAVVTTTKTYPSSSVAKTIEATPSALCPIVIETVITTQTVDNSSSAGIATAAVDSVCNSSKSFSISSTAAFVTNEERKHQLHHHHRQRQQQQQQTEQQSEYQKDSLNNGKVIKTIASTITATTTNNKKLNLKRSPFPNPKEASDRLTTLRKRRITIDNFNNLRREEQRIQSPHHHQRQHQLQRQTEKQWEYQEKSLNNGK